MDLLSEVGKKVGFKYRVQLVKDGSYGRQDESGNWNGMIGEVMRGVSTRKLIFGEWNSAVTIITACICDSWVIQRLRWHGEYLHHCGGQTSLFMYSMQEADLAIAPLTLTEAREKVVAMTTPFMQTGISILLRRDISEESGFFDFLSPFTAQTWVGILAAYLGTAACIFVVTRFVVSEL